MESAGPDMTKPIGKAPRTRTCYICGRGYGLSSFEIHLKQCKELWIKREEQKPKRERKPVPEDPFLRMHEGKSVGGTSEFTTGEISGSFGNSDISAAQLEAMNAAAQNSYNDVALFKCEWCGRSFLEEKLKIHNRSCTQDNPARRVDAKVKVGKTDVKVSGPTSSPKVNAKTDMEPSPPYRPKTTGSSNHGRNRSKIQIDEVIHNDMGGKLAPKPVAGNIGGGLVGQSHKLQNRCDSPRGQKLPQNEAPQVHRNGFPISKDEKINMALTQLQNLEEANLLISKSICDLKELIYSLQNDNS